MNTKEALLDSWDRQCRIVDSMASLVDENTRDVLPSPDGWPLYHQLAHIHLVRKYWLSQFSPEHGKNLGETFVDGWQTPIQDLDEIKGHLKQSAQAVRDAVEANLENPNYDDSGAYKHPVHFLQHMVWHEGWHVGLINLGLRLAGKEPADEWAEEHIWSEWRIEEWE